MRIARNTITPSEWPTRNALAIATPSKKVCSSSPARAVVPATGVGLHPEVEMRRHGMLGEVHGEVSAQHEQRRPGPAARERLGEELRDRHGQHEPRPERHRMLDDDEPAGEAV
jgi:hypothetical protein